MLEMTITQQHDNHLYPTDPYTYQERCSHFIVSSCGLSLGACYFVLWHPVHLRAFVISVTNHGHRQTDFLHVYRERNSHSRKRNDL